jgi:hypothetical protein
MYDVAVEPAPSEVGLLVLPPLVTDALFSMNEVVPVALAPERSVREVPLVELDDEPVAPAVPVAVA